MADPVTLAVVGATAGAVLNPNDPVKGAVIGGSLGYGGGALAGSAMGYGVLPGVGGEQAAMLAAQTGEFGLPGLLATGEAASMNPMTAGLFGMGNQAMLPAGKMNPLQGAMAGSMLMPKPPQRPLPRAPQIQSRPYTGMKLPVNQEEDMKRRMMIPPVPQISLL